MYDLEALWDRRNNVMKDGGKISPADAPKRNGSSLSKAVGPFSLIGVFRKDMVSAHRCGRRARRRSRAPSDRREGVPRERA